MTNKEYICTCIWVCHNSHLIFAVHILHCIYTENFKVTTGGGEQMWKLSNLNKTFFPAGQTEGEIVHGEVCDENVALHSKALV